MNIENFRKRLDKLKSSNDEFEYKLNNSFNEINFALIELQIGKEIPEKIKIFLKELNGLKTTNPEFQLLELETLENVNDFIHFATFDSKIEICFKIDKLNNANEWTIINKETGYEITKTISSFWSNKIWHWLEQKHKIWANNWWEN